MKKIINRILIVILLIIAVGVQSYATLIFAGITYFAIKEVEKID